VIGSSRRAGEVYAEVNKQIPSTPYGVVSPLSRGTLVADDPLEKGGGIRRCGWGICLKKIKIKNALNSVVQFKAKKFV